MRTEFTAEQLRAPQMREADAILRKCVHCGFCTATCPTYLLLGEENDGPRGRIWQIKTMLETGRADAATAAHLDRCLTCLSCASTCPSGVDYGRLVDIARVRLEHAPRARVWHRRLARALIAAVVPYPRRLKWALRLARPGRFAAPLLRRAGPLRPLAGMLEMAGAPPDPLPRAPEVFPPQGSARGRVALLAGCAQSVLAGRIGRAAVHLLTTAGYEVVMPSSAGCCGAVVAHMGKEERAKALARANIAAWERARVDAVLIDASGCASTIADYGRLLADDPQWADAAARIAAKARDIGVFLAASELPPMRAPRDMTVMFHAPCSLTHALQQAATPPELLRRAGFQVATPAEPHICCGAAGVYGVFEPEISNALRQRKLANLQAVEAAVIASANYGCMAHLQGSAARPVVHYLELLSWAAGGPAPAGLA